MKLDMDLIRQILLAVESAPDFKQLDVSDLKVDGYTADQLAYHSAQLVEAGYIDGSVLPLASQDAPVVCMLNLTWKGHEFVNATGDPSVWAKTKERVAKVGGKVSVAVIVEIASAIGKSIIGL
jgi:hypothetical protein